MVTLITLGLFILNPTGAMYIYSILPEEYQGYLWIYISSLVLETFSTTLTMTTVSVGGYVMLAYLYSAKAWLAALK